MALMDHAVMWQLGNHIRVTCVVCGTAWLAFRKTYNDQEPAFYFQRILKTRAGWEQVGATMFRYKSGRVLDTKAFRTLMHFVLDVEIREVETMMSARLMLKAVPKIAQQVLSYYFTLRHNTGDALICPTEAELEAECE